MKEFSFFVVADTHYFKNSLGAYGKEYENFMDYEQKCFAETESMNIALFDYLAANDKADTIIIAGDLSFNGEKESHKAFSALLRDFKQKTGKRIFVVTAGHDADTNTFAYDDTGRISPEGTKFDELYDFYREFGYDDAIAFNREHLSYVAELSDDIRLLVICNDTAEGSNQEYDDDFCDWIEKQADKAREDGKLMLAMEHYPVLAGQPILNVFPDARVKNSKKFVELLADNGVHLIFTGHMHNQSINLTHTEKGNNLYDICTGSAIGCPAYIRHITVKDKDTIAVRSIPVPDFEWDKRGLSCEDYLKEQFDRMLKTYLYSIEKDPQRFFNKLNIKYNPAMEKPVRFVGRKLSSLRLGTIGKLLMIKIDRSIKDKNFFDFAIEIVRNIFVGNQPFVEGTPEGDALLSLFKKIKPFVKTIKGSQGEEFDTYELLKHTVGNYGIDDYNAEIKL